MSLLPRRSRSWWPKFALLGVALISFASCAFPQNFKVTLLGTGSPRPVMERFGPSILVEAGKEKLLFDCGRGATQRLFQLKVPISEVTALFLTHLHSDHIVGIPDFYLTGWIFGRSTPLRVWGPVGTADMVSHLEQAYQFDIHMRRDVDEGLPPQGVVIVAKDIEQSVVYQNGDLKVTAFAVDHAPITPALGYRVDYAGHSVVLSGDTRFNENLIHFAQGTDVLIHEVLDPEAYWASDQIYSPEQKQRVINHHTTPEQAGTVFGRVKPKLAVYSHVVPFNVNAQDLVAHTRKTYSGPLEVGEDLMSIDIGEKIDVHRAPK
jgi:ribonuclease Z